MKKIFLSAILSLLSFLASNAQSSKGFSVSSASQNGSIGKTYALIVGISQYRDTAIQQLRFADRDALAFKDFLIADGVDSNNIIILLNKEATGGWIKIWAYQLCVDSVKKGDRLFIYFSGHGDVESKVITRLGYLLPYDATNKVYSVSSIDVRTIQDYVTTASSNGAQVVVIADACHAGNLAGGSEGLKNIANVLNENWKDEIKILSCQPGEASLEDSKWGGGRGLFSYYLIQGMAGLADLNGDGKVKVNEVSYYLSQKVHDAADPIPQNPVVLGNMEETLFASNTPYLHTIAATNDDPNFASIKLKGMESQLAASLSDSAQKYFRLYQLEMDSNHTILYDSSDQLLPSAYYYFKKMPVTDSTKLLVSVMKRNLGAAMIDELNSMISSVVNNSTFIQYGYSIDNYEYTRELEELLGMKKVTSLGLVPKIIYMDAVGREKHPLDNPSPQLFESIDSVVKMDPYAAYAATFYAHILAVRKRFTQSKDYAIQALEVSPGIAYANRTLAEDYLYLNQPDSCIEVAKRLAKIQKESNYLPLALAYFLLNQNDSSDYYFMKYFGTSDTKSIILSSAKYKAELFFKQKKFAKAIPFYKITLEEQKKWKEEPEEHYAGGSRSGNISQLSNQYFQIACCFAMFYKTDSAAYYFKQSLEVAFKNFNYFKEDPKIYYYSDALNEGFSEINGVPQVPELQNLRSTMEYLALMKKYFPDQYIER